MKDQNEQRDLFSVQRNITEILFKMDLQWKSVGSYWGANKYLCKTYVCKTIRFLESVKFIYEF